MTRRQGAHGGRVEVTVNAPIEWVWRIIADVTRTGEWSHECRHVEWLGGATAPAPGVRFRGRNHSGWIRWSRACEVLAVDPQRRIAWRTISTALYVDSTDWEITLEPVAGATRIVQSYQLTKCPQWWEQVALRLVPAHIDRTVALEGDLRRLGALAAADARSADRLAS